MKHCTEVVQHCTLGFVLSNNDRQSVLLLEKESPPEHQGMLNGIGGKIELAETPLACIRRECREETGLQIAEDRWYLIERGFTFSGSNLFIYAAICPAGQRVTQGDTGLAHWYPLMALPTQVVPDVPRLLQIAVRQSRSMKREN